MWSIRWCHDSVSGLRGIWNTFTFIFNFSFNLVIIFGSKFNVVGFGEVHCKWIAIKSRDYVAEWLILTLILPRSRTGTVWLYTSTSNKRAARPKLYTKSLTRDLKLMYSCFTLMRISINLNSSQLNMFREIILPIFRSTTLCVTAWGVHYTTSYNTQSSASEDG